MRSSCHFNVPSLYPHLQVKNQVQKHQPQEFQVKNMSYLLKYDESRDGQLFENLKSCVEKFKPQTSQQPL